jgi:hypothetical protein
VWSLDASTDSLGTFNVKHGLFRSLQHILSLEHVRFELAHLHHHGGVLGLCLGVRAGRHDLVGYERAEVRKKNRDSLAEPLSEPRT